MKLNTNEQTMLLAAARRRIVKNRVIVAKKTYAESHLDSLVRKGLAQRRDTLVVYTLTDRGVAAATRVLRARALK